MHLDVETGDRKSRCEGEMEPIAIAVKRDGEWSLVHQCCRCRAMRVNRIAGDDSVYALLALAARPMGRLPFPPPG